MSNQKQGAVTLKVAPAEDAKPVGTATFTNPAPVATPVRVVLPPPAPVTEEPIDDSDDIAPSGPPPVSVERVKPAVTPGMSVRPARPGEIVEYRYRCGCPVPIIGRITQLCETHGQPQMTETCPKCGAPKAGYIADPKNIELEGRKFRSPCTCEITKQEIDRFQVILKYVLDNCSNY